MYSAAARACCFFVVFFTLCWCVSFGFGFVHIVPFAQTDVAESELLPNEKRKKLYVKSLRRKWTDSKVQLVHLSTVVE